MSEDNESEWCCGVACRTPFCPQCGKAVDSYKANLAQLYEHVHSNSQHYVEVMQALVERKHCGSLVKRFTSAVKSAYKWYCFRDSLGRLLSRDLKGDETVLKAIRAAASRYICRAIADADAADAEGEGGTEALLQQLLSIEAVSRMGITRSEIENLMREIEAVNT